MRCELFGIGDRPGLIAALSARGIAAGANGGGLAIARWDGGAAPRPSMLALVAGTGEEIVVAALDSGFADAVAESASDALIAARAAALLRHRVPVLTIGELAIDLAAREASRCGCALALLPREYALLLCLSRRVGEVISRADLRMALWGRATDPGTNVLEVHISRLRAKLDRDFARPMLLTEKGLGYRLVA